MDPSPLFDPQYLGVIVATLIGFFALAAALLVPVYRFLDREEEIAKDWRPEEVAKRLRERENGAPGFAQSASEGTESSTQADGEEDETTGGGSTT